MKKQNMNLPALFICAFLLQSILAEDDDGYPKLSNKLLSITVTTVEATQPPLSILAEDDDAYLDTTATHARVQPRPNRRVQLDYNDNVSLKWVNWSGSLPQWAVKVYINGTGQDDYICAPHTGCYWSPGYYNPSKGPFCFNPCHGKEAKSSTFDILVNEQNLELLEWKAFDSDFKNMVTSCASGLKDRVYVGKSISGIGAITKGSFIIVDDVTIRFSPERHIFYLPSGTETRHLEGFDVLTLKTGKYKQRIHDIEYLTDELVILSEQLTVFDKMTVENRNCREIEQEVTLESSREGQSTWETGISSALVVSASLEATVPSITYSSRVVVGSNLETVTNGNSLTQTTSHSLTLKVNVPAGHSCVVKLVGKIKEFNIPYKAQLSKEFTDGRVHTVTVSGMFKGVQVEREMQEVAERCTPLPKPCKP